MGHSRDINVPEMYCKSMGNVCSTVVRPVSHGARLQRLCYTSDLAPEYDPPKELAEFVKHDRDGVPR